MRRTTYLWLWSCRTSTPTSARSNVRVIEIPKPRWTTYDANFFGIDMRDDVAVTVQDRAYTSAIWYTP